MSFMGSLALHRLFDRGNIKKLSDPQIQIMRPAFPSGRLWRRSGRTAASRTPFGVRHFLLCAAIIVLMFSNDESNALTSQVLGVAIFILSAAMFFFGSRYQEMTIAPIDAVMLLSVLLSFLAATISEDTYSLTYTTIFLCTYISVMVIAQRTTPEELAMCVRVSTIMILALVIVTFGDTLLTSLVPGAQKRWELRAAPFGMHPNLAGFVYGGFIVMAVNSRTLVRRYNKLLTPAIIALCLAVMLVASARGGLLAIVLTLVVYVMTEVVRGKRSIAYIIIFGVGLLIVSAIYWNSIVSYTNEMLALNSQERGLQSGGSGRLDIWAHGIDYIASRTWEIFIGSGMRTARNMGFEVESSYINLAVESGIFMSALVLTTFLSILMNCYRRQAKGSAFHRFAMYTLLFAMFQSVFNRYLIGIGNPFSLFILVIASKASPRFRLSRAASAAPPRTAMGGRRNDAVLVPRGRIGK